MSAAVVASESDPRAAAQALARSLAQEAEQIYALAQPGPSLALAERAVVLARQCGDSPLLGWALMLVGKGHSDLGNHLQAFAAAREAYDLLADCGDPAHRLSALNTCNLVLWAGGETDRAIELLRNGLAATAGRPDLAAGRSAMLLNMAFLLRQEAGEYAEAIRCCSEGVALVTSLPLRPTRWTYATAYLAFLHLEHAKHLADKGLHDRASAEFEAAARTLPPMDFQSWRTFSYHEHLILQFQLSVLAGLANWPRARQAAAATLWSLRGLDSGHIVQVNKLEALADFYRRAGRAQRAIRYESKLLAALRAAKNEPDAGRCMRRLADLHAQTGDHALALDCCKQLAALQNRQRLEAGELRGRLAVIEREATRRRDQANEERAHAQRLAVIGRLIAQTHHALSAPAEQAHRLTAQALERLSRPAPASLVPMLQELNQTVDRAAGLVSQLKLFSYRSAPQPMALSLRDALLGAYQSLAPHIGVSARRLPEIEVTADTPEQAWADTQRLGIMLRVLLIELAQWTGSAGGGVAIRARIASDAPSAVSLHIEARGSADPQAAAGALASLGGTLCMEIANEMGGALEAACDDSGVLTYKLCLPGAGAHLPRLLQTLP
jgi:tetratricopeptide (TPR) repeat protein